MRIRFGGRSYYVSRKRSNRAHYKLDGEVDYTSRRIFICPLLKGKPLLESLVHEGIHASFPDLSEDAVEAAAKAITDLSYRFGFDQVE